MVVPKVPGKITDQRRFSVSKVFLGFIYEADYLPLSIPRSQPKWNRLRPIRLRGHKVEHAYGCRLLQCDITPSGCGDVRDCGLVGKSLSV